MARKSKRIEKLSKEQKKLVWASLNANAGAGWQSRWENKEDSRKLEEGKPLE